jgi:hypothetical protein
LKEGEKMTDTKLLEDLISKSGKKKGFLAKRVKLSRQGFRNCVINKAEFTASQIDILCEELNITSLKLRQAVFFAKIGS